MVEGAALEILAFSTMLALLSATLRRIVLKREDMLAMQEVTKFNRDLMKALREKDMKAIERLEKKKEYMQMIQTRIMSKNILIMVVSMAIFFTFFFFADARYGKLVLLELPPGLHIPFISQEGGIGFFGWYLLTFFSVSLPINKFLSTRLETRSQPTK